LFSAGNFFVLARFFWELNLFGQLTFGKEGILLVGCVNQVLFGR
jgi:hypothetical protein